ALQERALALEEAAPAVPGVTTSEGAGVSAARTVVALATSAGFVAGYTASGYGAGVGVIAGSGGAMQRDSASHQARHFADLDPAEELGTLAGTRAVRRLDPARPPSGAMPVVFDPRVGGSLVGHLIGALSGAAVARRTSFLLGRDGERLFAEQIHSHDDPHRPRGLRSKPFDGEGVATGPRALVEGGRVTGGLMNAAAARQLGLEVTGHATRGSAGAPGI